MGVDLILIVVGGFTRWLVVLLLVAVPAAALVIVVVGVTIVILLVVSLVARLLRWWLRVTVVVIVDLSSWSIPLLRLVFSLFLTIEMTTTISPAIMRLRWLVTSARRWLVVLVITSATVVASLISRWVPTITLWFVIIGVVLHWSSRSCRGLLILLLLVP